MKQAKSKQTKSVLIGPFDCPVTELGKGKQSELLDYVGPENKWAGCSKEMTLESNFALRPFISWRSGHQSGRSDKRNRLPEQLTKSLRNPWIYFNFTVMPFLNRIQYKGEI